jgi:hypothetical protein
LEAGANCGLRVDREGNGKVMDVVSPLCYISRRSGDAYEAILIDEQ